MLDEYTTCKPANLEQWPWRQKRPGCLPPSRPPCVRCCPPPAPPVSFSGPCSSPTSSSLEAGWDCPGQDLSSCVCHHDGWLSTVGCPILHGKPKIRFLMVNAVNNVPSTFICVYFKFAFIKFTGTVGYKGTYVWVEFVAPKRLLFGAYFYLGFV